MHDVAFRPTSCVCVFSCLWFHFKHQHPTQLSNQNHAIVRDRPLHDIFRDLAKKGSHVANAHSPRPAAVLDYLRSVIVCKDMKTLNQAYEVVCRGYGMRACRWVRLQCESDCVACFFRPDLLVPLVNIMSHHMHTLLDRVRVGPAGWSGQSLHTRLRRYWQHWRRSLREREAAGTAWWRPRGGRQPDLFLGQAIRSGRLIKINHLNIWVISCEALLCLTLQWMEK